jgi:hypothetical protein
MGDGQLQMRDAGVEIIEEAGRGAGQLALEARDELRI